MTTAAEGDGDGEKLRKTTATMMAKGDGGDDEVALRRVDYESLGDDVAIEHCEV
ncbi:putative pre-mRNA-splicing factor CWC22-like protein [Iris pallida]|uniref:Pre-mRNA-splicing factor CWC22-like protein n=1 Tax=Iris pallida TaxID=29817 RepID=A0AAX6E7M8_IRIPA|nr:putative pre-mRNA-splicing factor CWC22-like protein [Iris pallida]KAJ6799282.1 putative pre-mRNA-splicing factor CWC22-like protein [Iris pallida]KAJ6799970.1 putative pre-mRNA-splicing factor CWC22-like protein [Iris pallida]KAJ6812974.1 putative pre-mRNA-splicing factor CWC22-like protein [Iris pallida]KAJ6835029.1 putative pre-mRNA-splicing factor CWC22-like protein [Iris pallida]